MDKRGPAKLMTEIGRNRNVGFEAEIATKPPFGITLPPWSAPILETIAF